MNWSSNNLFDLDETFFAVPRWSISCCAANCFWRIFVLRFSASWYRYFQRVETTEEEVGWESAIRFTDVWSSITLSEEFVDSWFKLVDELGIAGDSCGIANLYSLSYAGSENWNLINVRTISKVFRNEFEKIQRICWKLPEDS